MTVGGFFSALFVGIVVGYLGRWLAPGRHGRADLGLLLTLLIGIVAALAGTAIAHGLDLSRFIVVFPIQVVTAALVVTAFRRLSVR
jgi:uncharacterized membrane protein YeaQ/YmgE (transglycosylase-associated protein family)